MGIQFTGLASGMDTQSIIADLMKAERIKVEKVEKEKTLVEWKKEAWSEMNSELYSFYKKELFEFKSIGTYNQKEVTSSNANVVDAKATSSAVSGSHTIDVIQMAKGSFLTGNELTTDINGDDISLATTAEELIDFNALIPAGTETATFRISLDNGANYSEITINKTDSIAQIVSDINALDMDMNVAFDENFNRLFFSSTETGSGVQLKVDGTNEFLTALGFNSDTDPDPGVDNSNRAGTAGQNAIFNYNGTTLTSSTNVVTVNGLELTLKGENETVNISVNHDVDAIYDRVKNFITKYNELTLKISEKLDADYNKDYMPLTDDEKKAMTEDEIKLWEEKIKKSLLRRDDILSSVAHTMRSTLTLSSGVDTSGFNYNYLSDLGIVTGNWTEKGILHIEGDEDESLYALKKNKLKEAIENDPESISEFFTALGQKIYDKMSDSMKSSTLSSALTFYNDKHLDKQIEDYEDKIYDLEDRLTSVEERYYRQFTAMEQAIQQSNSTGAWLAQQLGGM